MTNLTEIVKTLEGIVGHPLELQYFKASSKVIEKNSNTPIYLINKGICKVFIYNSKGDEIELGDFGTGCILGEMSNFNHTSTSADVLATTDVEVYVIPPEHYLALWSISPEVSHQLYCQMCQRLSNTNENLLQNVNQLVDLQTRLEEKVDEQVQSIRDKNEELLKKQDELIQLIETRDSFLNMAIHDLRSPLSIIKGYLDLLQSGELSDRHRQEALKILMKNTSGMLFLVNDLLGISKINRHKMSLDLDFMDIQPLLKDLVNGAKILSDQKDMILKLDMMEPLPYITVDHRRLSEIIHNLLSNAIKFTARGKKITLKVYPTAKDLVFEVTDQGQGIPETELPKLFKSFERISTKATEGEACTGLGLAIVKRLVELHEGQVEVKSTFGLGSTFSFTIPRKT
jgi:signal transduction histidine kinase